jgi:hypothetical protein
MPGNNTKGNHNQNNTFKLVIMERENNKVNFGGNLSQSNFNQYIAQGTTHSLVLQ